MIIWNKMTVYGNEFALAKAKMFYLEEIANK